MAERLGFCPEWLEHVWIFLTGPKMFLFLPVFTFLQLRNSGYAPSESQKTDKKITHFGLRQKNPDMLYRERAI
jgi:hypothetical protein